MNLQPSAPAAHSAEERYFAPPPPPQGRVIGLDCHPDSFTAAVFTGRGPHDARKIDSRHQLSLEALLQWAREKFGPQDLFLMEAGSNSFAVCRRLEALGLRAIVLESSFVGKHAKSYADNDRMAAARIALVYFGNKVPCVWVPDELTRQRRELLHCYQKAVSEHTAASNALKSYLNGRGIRLGKRSLSQSATRKWVERQAPWSTLQAQLLEDYWDALCESAARRTRMRKLIALQMAGEALMLRVMKLLGIGMINAFALLAVIGEVKRFAEPGQLVAYVGLNPGQRESGESKHVSLGIGRRGRGDLRALLIQSAQAVLRSGKATALGQWGWKLFARRGSRNIAVAAVARKLLVQVWHLLKGNPPLALENNRGVMLKLKKLAVVIGKQLRKELGLGKRIEDTVQLLKARMESAPPCVESAPPCG